jgi:ABC-type nitrate/sulfonate/bicarbonate transport system permease component
VTSPPDPGGPEFDTGPGPSKVAFFVAYIGVVLAGLLGAAIGYGFVDAACRGDCTTEKVIGAVVAGAGAAVGVGVVAVLTLRAMAEWKRQPPGR